jgi:hypothetical protein
VLQKRFKVLIPIERADGTTFWVRGGNGYTNKDESINVYMDVAPLANKGHMKIQLRELTEEDLRERSERRANAAPPRPPAAPAQDSIPF